jgi:hypothetical protein
MGSYPSQQSLKNTNSGRYPMKKVLLLAALAALGVLAAPPLAAAEERTCRGTLGATTVDNLRVPQARAASSSARA